MRNEVAITLPGGYWAEGTHWQVAHLRELTGEDHLFLMEECRGLPLAQWVTEALTRCVTRLGPYQPTREAIRSLTIGDREALLLNLRRLTMGERFRCVLFCPAQECNEKLEFELDAADLLLPPYTEVRQEHNFRVPHDHRVVRFRLPTGSDQEAAATLVAKDPSAAVHLLIRRCVQSVTPDDGAVQEFPDELTTQLALSMAELDGQAEITLRITCTACSGSFSLIFDTASYLILELEAGMRNLYREVHLLTYHYHWSATEILRMSARKRLRFLQLLNDQLTLESTQ